MNSAQCQQCEAKMTDNEIMDYGNRCEICMKALAAKEAEEERQRQFRMLDEWLG